MSRAPRRPTQAPRGVVWWNTDNVSEGPCTDQCTPHELVVLLRLGAGRPFSGQPVMKRMTMPPPRAPRLSGFVPLPGL